MKLSPIHLALFPNLLQICIQIFQHSIEVGCAAPEQFQETPKLQNDELNHLVQELLPTLLGNSCLSAAFQKHQALEAQISLADGLSRRICELLEVETMPDVDRLITPHDFM